MYSYVPSRVICDFECASALESDTGRCRILGVGNTDGALETFGVYEGGRWPLTSDAGMNGVTKIGFKRGIWFYMKEGTVVGAAMLNCDDSPGLVDRCREVIADGNVWTNKEALIDVAEGLGCEKWKRRSSNARFQRAKARSFKNEEMTRAVFGRTLNQDALTLKEQ